MVALASPQPPPPGSSRPYSVRGLVRGSTLLLLGRLISKFGGFVTQVLIVRYLSRGDFGSFTYALSAITLAQSVMTLGLDRSLVRFLSIFHERRDNRKLLGTMAMTLLVILVLGVVTVLALYGGRGILSVWIKDQRSVSLLLVLVFLAPLQALDEVLVGVFAVFAKPRAIFLRRHVLAPALKLVVVLGLILSGSDVFILALGYLIATLVGVAIYGPMVVRLLRAQGVFEATALPRLIVPWREVFAFSLPLLISDLVYVCMNAVNVLMLEHYWDTIHVANLQAVLPTARLNELVMVSFATLFTPLAARMFANDDHAGINQLYWRTAAWIAIFSFPIFVLTFSLAQPITLLLFGARYEPAAPILAMLSLGYYFNAALGFNGLTLKVFGRIRYVLAISVITIVVSVGLSLLLIPSRGAFGAGIAMMISMIVHNLLKQAGLVLGTGVRLFEWRYLRVYGAIALCALGLFGIQEVMAPPVAVSLALTALASLVMLRANGRLLNVGGMFPEVMRLPGMSLLLEGRGRRGDPRTEPAQTE